jgi:predicted transcriptional regulator
MREAAPRHAHDGLPGTARRAAGALEAEVLGILRDAGGPLSPGEVRQRVASGQRGELSYSTVVTIVSRLHDKGLLNRQRAGRGFTYTPVDEASIAASRMSQALGSGSDRDAVLTRFVSGLSGRDTRLLRNLLAGSPRAPADSPRSAAYSPRSAADSPRPAADSPRPAADSPRSATDSPRSATDGPRSGADDLDREREEE